MTRIIRQSLCFLFAVVFINGCDQCDQYPLAGSWYYVNVADSSYSEMYFTKEFYVANSEEEGVSPAVDYVVSNDSVFLLNRSIFFFRILETKANRLSVSGKLGEPVELIRVQVPISTYTGFVLSDDNYQELSRGRIFRGNDVLDSMGLAKSEQEGLGEDSIIYLPPIDP